MNHKSNADKANKAADNFTDNSKENTTKNAVENTAAHFSENVAESAAKNTAKNTAENVAENTADTGEIMAQPSEENAPLEVAEGEDPAEAPKRRHLLSRIAPGSIRYVPVGKPDTEALSRLILAAKGEERTMAQFAEACGNVPGVSPSTFSRILNRTVKRPLSTALLKTIAENAANPEIVTYDKLLVANGMIKEDEFKYYGSSEGQQNRTELRKKHGYIAHAGVRGESDQPGPGEREEVAAEERNMNSEMRHLMRMSAMAEVEEVIFFSLIKRGFQCAKIRYLAQKDELFVREMVGDLFLRVQGEEMHTWAFNIVAPADSYMSSPNGDGSVKWGPLTVRARNWIERRFIDYYCPLFLRDMWKKESLANVRISFVLFDEPLYDSLCEKLSKIKVNGHMSLILVDMNGGDVISETMLNRVGGEPAESLFDREKIDMDDEVWDEKEDFEYDPWTENKENRRR